MTSFKGSLAWRVADPLELYASWGQGLHSNDARGITLSIAPWSGGWHSSLRLRRLGPYPLIEDDSVRSDGSTLVNLAVGKRWQHWGVELDVLNLLDSDDHDIDYYYASRLSGEPADGVEDCTFM